MSNAASDSAALDAIAEEARDAHERLADKATTAAWAFVDALIALEELGFTAIADNVRKRWHDVDVSPVGNGQMDTRAGRVAYAAYLRHAHPAELVDYLNSFDPVEQELIGRLLQGRRA